MKSKPRSKTVHLILNGKVAANEVLRAAVARHRAAGHRIEVRVTWEAGDAKRFVSEAGEVDLVVAVGGGRDTKRGPSWLDGALLRCATPPGNSAARYRQ